MQCPNCGHEVRGKFCGNCGTRVADSPPAPPQAAGDSGATAAIRPEDLRDMMAGASSGQPSYGTTAQQSYSGTGSALPSGDGPSGGYGFSQSSPQGMARATPSFGRSAGPQGLPGGVAVPPGVQQALVPLEALGKRLTAWIGCALLLVGLFVAAKTYSVSAGVFSVSGSRSLWDYATFWSVILLLLIVASAGLAYLRDYKWLVITGAGSFIILILNFLYAFSTGVSYAGISARPSWGWILLFPGALLIMAAGAMPATGRDAVDDYGLNRFIASLQNRVGNR